MRNNAFLLLLASVGILLAGAGCSSTATTTISPANDSIAARPVDEAVTDNHEDVMTDDKEAIMKDELKDRAMMGKKESGTMMKEEKKDSMMMGAMKGRGTYEDYDSNKLFLAKDGKIILFFKASWCPTCQAVDKDILANLGEIPSATHILKVDYDTSSELKKQYGVTYQHTFVQVDANGTMIKKWSGSPTLAKIVNELQ